MTRNDPSTIYDPDPQGAAAVAGFRSERWPASCWNAGRLEIGIPGRLRRNLQIEGTLSKAVRVNGLRRSRYIGAAKTHLQQVLTAAAINLGRIAEWIAGNKPAQTRKSAFVRLMAAPA